MVGGPPGREGGVPTRTLDAELPDWAVVAEAVVVVVVVVVDEEDDESEEESPRTNCSTGTSSLRGEGAVWPGEADHEGNGNGRADDEGHGNSNGHLLSTE